MFDFTKLNPQASKLDLRVYSANEMKCSIAVVAHQIPASIQSMGAAVVLVVKPFGIGDESICCLLGLAQVTACQYGSLNQKLTDGY